MAGGSTPKSIALWGYGRYGKRLFQRIKTYWGKRYRVTAVFDGSVESDGVELPEGALLLNSSRIAEEYQAGLFDAVIVSVVEKNQHSEIKETLEALGIPSTGLITQAELLPMESFERVSSCSFPFGFMLHEYESLYGFYAPLYMWDTHLFFFDEHGHALIDNWFVEYLQDDPWALNPAFPFDKDVAPVVRLAGDYCAVARYWGKNYWHFTYQLLDQVSLMENSGFKGKYLAPRSSQAEELFTLAEVDLKRIAWLDDFDRNAIYHFERLSIFARKTYSHKQSAQPLLEIAPLIEKNARQAEDVTRVFPSRLFVKRIGTRRLLDVEDYLDLYGFQTIVPEELTVAEQIQYFAHADIVLSPHGANSTNSLYMRPGSVFIETFGKGWVNPCCAETLRGKGIHYFPIVETPIMNSYCSDSVSDYRVDKSILAMAIESAIQLVEGGR